MITNTATFALTATFVGHAGEGSPQYVYVKATLPTLTDAQALAAHFPKSAKVVASTLSRPVDFDDFGKGTETVGTVRFEALLVATANNGGRNETGVKRYRSFRRTVAKLGLPVEFAVTPRTSNAYQTEADFEAAIA